VSGPAALDGVEVEALVTDRYLEALLAAAERRAPDAPADPALDPALRRAALRLLRLQAPGRRALSAADYLNARHDLQRQWQADAGHHQ